MDLIVYKNIFTIYNCIKNTFNTSIIKLITNINNLFK